MFSDQDCRPSQKPSAKNAGGSNNMAPTSAAGWHILAAASQTMDAWHSLSKPGNRARNAASDSTSEMSVTGTM